MNKLYELILYVENEGYNEGFGIGIFSTYKKAIDTKERYIREVAGFKDYECDYKIYERQVIGECKENLDVVYQFQGWNTDEDDDEIDIYYSNCYTLQDTAKAEMKKEKCRRNLENWVINRIKIDECEWKEGFERLCV